MIELTGVTKRYGHTIALAEVNFSAPEGSRSAVLGPSGSGKTTLLRLIAGLELPDHGEVKLAGRMAGRPGWALPPHQRDVGMVFQSPALWPHMTVVQHIQFALPRLRPPARQEKIAELVLQCALGGLEQRYPAQLSGGEARRVALARALAAQPRILLMDEPLTNLDTALKNELLALLQTVVANAVTLVYVTHAEEEAAALCDRSWLLHKGRLQENCTPAGVTSTHE